MQENLNDFWKVVSEYWMLILVVVATAATAMLRTAKEHGKADYIEASLCSLFATSIWFMLDWLGLPSEVGIGIGVFIAYIGTLRFSNWVRSKLGIE
jgi:lambda family phage holin